jgi:putative sterol carrier protein
MRLRLLLAGWAAVLGFMAFAAAPSGRAEEAKSGRTSDISHSPEDVFRAMHKVFQSEKARGLHIRYFFHLTEPQGGDWWITVNDGKMAMGKGSIEKPDCTISCTGTDWVALDNETLGGTRAYLTGRLHISGDRGLARKLNELFP